MRKNELAPLKRKRKPSKSASPTSGKRAKRHTPNTAMRSVAAM